MEFLTQFIGAPSNAITLIIVLSTLFFQLADKGLLKVGRNNSEKPKINPQEIEYIKKDINEIKENHLKHIESNIIKLQSDVAFIKGKLSK